MARFPINRATEAEVNKPSILCRLSGKLTVSPFAFYQEKLTVSPFAFPKWSGFYQPFWDLGLVRFGPAF